MKLFLILKLKIKYLNFLINNFLKLYNTPFLEALGTGGQINAFNQSLYSTSLSNELNSWTSANNKNSYLLVSFIFYFLDKI